MTEQLWTLGASELAARIRRKDVSSREVVEAHLRRIDAVNPRINAITVNLGESALDAADAADRALAAGDPVRPLHGVPMTVKENLDVTGSATSHGVTAFRDQLPRADSPHIAELRAAGAIPLGRALAVGMTPLGMGNDIAGSLRWPSQCCGTTALKPSLGRIARASQLEVPTPVSLAGQMLAVDGPMARHVCDLRLAFAHMCSPCPSDPWHVPVPLEGSPVASPVRGAGSQLLLQLLGCIASAANCGGFLPFQEGLRDANVFSPVLVNTAGVQSNIPNSTALAFLAGFNNPLSKATFSTPTVGSYLVRQQLPEPSTAILLLVGGFAALASRRRRTL